MMIFSGSILSLMKASLTVLFLVGLLTGCQPKTVQPPERDAATIVAGKYKLTKVTGPINEEAALVYYKPATSLVVTKLSATAVKATYTMPTGTSPFSETWTVTKVSDDTVKIESQGIYVDQYQKGQIIAGFADRTLYLWFEQVKP